MTTTRQIGICLLAFAMAIAPFLAVIWLLIWWFGGGPVVNPFHVVQ